MNRETREKREKREKGKVNNPDFNRVEFEAVKNESGSNAFVMTPTKWASLTRAIDITSKYQAVGRRCLR